MPNQFQMQKEAIYTKKIRDILLQLPDFCEAFFRSLANKNLSVLTRYGYAVDLRSFFRFLTAEDQLFSGRPLSSLTIADLKLIRTQDIERYLEFVSLYYTASDRERSNHDKSRKRKLSAIRSFFKYYFKLEALDADVAALVEMPKINDNAIVRLEPNEIATLLDQAENGENLSARQKAYHMATRTRDVAILTLFLGTGIRISELVGIDCSDIDFSNNAFSVVRKGGNQEILALSNEVAEALASYAEERALRTPLEGHEKAFFLSMQNRRMTARAVENLVKKYARDAVPLKKITPHKLRSTYGTLLYQESNDIYLVADVLGHKDVNTTRKHYAAQSEDNRRKAARLIHLREDE